MAIGWSGSGGGIGEAYRRVLYADIEAGVKKYQELLPMVSEDAKPLYETTIDGLELLLAKMKDFEGEK